MKEKIRIKRWVKVVIIVIVLLLLIGGFFVIKKQLTPKKETTIKETPKKLKPVKEEVIFEEPEIEPQVEVQEPIQDVYTTRMTSFWANDGYGTGECTGSGLCSWDFQVNENGWYTYDGKLVIATATTYLANQGWYVADGVHLYRYGDEVTLVIDGVEYDAIVKDSCGNCMKTDRIDLFVSNGSSARDTMVEVRRK